VLALASPALALLARGPIDTTTPGLGFPLWYQDSEFLALELNTAAGDPVDPTNPDSVAAGFGAEAFYWMAESRMTLPGAGDALLVMAVEAAWALEEPKAGDEVVFQRLRIRVDDLPVAGEYTVVHPYGEKTFNVVPDDKGVLEINATVDIGIGNFDWSVEGYIDPFLHSTSAPPGFVGDGATATTVTGSPQGTNYFEVQGPANSNIGGGTVDTFSTDLFVVQGKIYPGTPMNLDQATFSRDADSGRVNIWATVYGPGNVLDVSWPGTSPVALTAAGNGMFFATVPVASAADVPDTVAVTGNRGAGNQSSLDIETDDVVTIRQADYFVDSGTLVVEAVTSDGDSPALSVPGQGALVGGILTVTGVTVPPPVVEVVSAEGGSAMQIVNVALAPSLAPPVALDDQASVIVDGSVQIDVLGNDSATAPLSLDEATVTITADPVSGAVGVDPLSGLVTYTPNAGFTGVDTFSYTVNDSAGSTSNEAVVTVEVKPLHILSGTVTDQGSIMGVGFTLMKITQNGVLIDATLTDFLDGSYSFQVPDGTYVVTPFQFGRTFTPATDEVVVSGGPQAGVDFVRDYVVPQPVVTAPNTGGSFAQGTSVPVEFSVIWPAGGMLHTYAFVNGTYHWLNSQTASPGQTIHSFNWNVAQPVGTDYVIRVWYVDEAGNWLTFDDSDAAFEITEGTLPQPTVVAPNTGDPVAQGAVIPVDLSLANATEGWLHTYAFAGGTYYWLNSQATSAGVASYSFDWTVAEPAGTGYVVRTWFVDPAGNWLYFDDSEPSFEITAAP
jgi:hypothetical protein